MSNLRVLIYYSPRLYSELFSSVLKSICGIEVFDMTQETISENQPRTKQPDADLIITSLDADGKPATDQFPVKIRKSKILAFSPTGDIGLRRMPNSSQWEEISPFGLDQLIREVIYLHHNPRIPNESLSPLI